MTLNDRNPGTFLLKAFFLAILLASFLAQPVPAFALGIGEAALPSFSAFSKTVRNDQPGTLRGVYVPEVLALPVVQQPAGNAGYVSSTDGEVTQFDLASQFGNVGLLAHNYLSGDLFTQLAVGQEVRLVYGDGSVEYFVITQVLQYQALQPNSPYSAFRALSSDEQLTAEQVFQKVYAGERHVTFQTCITRFGNASWGRLFVMAVPVDEVSRSSHFFEKPGR